MGSNGKDEVIISKIDKAECSDPSVEIKIKTLDSQTYTLRVNKCVPVPTLKEKIANVTGVLSDQQRLICRGKVLMDDQLLSAYHVEDGHTLHMVVRQPIPPSVENLPDDNPTTDPASSPDHSPDGYSDSTVFVGTFEISGQGGGVFPDLNQLVSSVLSSFVMNGLGLSNLREPDSHQHTDQDVLTDQSNPLNGTFPSRPTAAPPLDPLQPPVISDSLTTLFQYLNRLRTEFDTVIGLTQPNSIHESVPASVAAAGQRGLPTQATLAEVTRLTRQILVEQVADFLTQLTRQLEYHTIVTDPLARAGVQSNVIRSGSLLQNLGALLLELGRTTMTLRMGQTPDDAIVNAGPSVFVSNTGPNPIIAQPLPFHPGTSFGANPIEGTLQTGSYGATSGSTFAQRNIDIRISTGNLNQNEQSQGVAETENDAPGSSVAVSTAREAQMQVLPIRAVVAVVPAHIRRDLLSSSSSNSVALLYPGLSGIEHATSGEHQNDSDNGRHGGVNSNAPTNLGTPNEETTIAPANTPESDAGVDGTMFSNILHQIMPHISQNMAMGSNIAPSERDVNSERQGEQASSSQENFNVGTSSSQRDDPSISPNSKRQKRE